ncbi:MAG: SUMF1/EgtB/PvdO family nonheme iron enzyme [Planctomycetia bacterium]|nr:SUMF1/EgtB/PvdO family nonheme iron enzyme [Planctomycetia bacterium]
MGRRSNRVLRGGSWNNNSRNTRSANRNRNTPDNRNNNNGFRVVCVSGPSTPRAARQCAETLSGQSRRVHESAGRAVA